MAAGVTTVRLVIGQRVARRATERSQRPIERHHHRPHRPIPERDDDPKRLHASQAQNTTVPRPATLGPSPKSHCIHSPASVTHGRRATPVLGPPATLRHRAARRALRTQIAHRHQSLMADIGADPPA
jgi:hypothetical protein